MIEKEAESLELCVALKFSEENTEFHLAIFVIIIIIRIYRYNFPTVISGLIFSVIVQSSLQSNFLIGGEAHPRSQT